MNAERPASRHGELAAASDCPPHTRRRCRGHIAPEGYCLCICSKCTDGKTGDCICPDCDPATCGAHT